MNTTRAPPPQGAPPSYAFVTRVYKRSLRPVVIAMAFVGGIWSLFSAIGFYRSAAALSDENVPKLVTFSIVLGILYMVVVLIEALGVGAAAMQKLRFIRAYALLSILSTLIILGAGLLRVIIHFTLKGDIIDECTNLATGDRVVYFGFWGPITRDVLDAQEAQDWCTRSWNRGSWTEIVALLITLVLASLMTAVAFSYLRQVLDPTSPVNARTAPVRVDVYPAHYNRPFDGSAPPYGYPAPPYAAPVGQYAPPPGPPPRGSDDDITKPPVYSGGDGSVGYGKDNKDPFADFDAPNYQEEHDVTSRPRPGGPQRF